MVKSNENTVLIWNHKENDVINSMTKQQIIESFSGGVTVGKGMDAKELILDKKGSKDNVLSLQAYDANMMPLTEFSKWSDKAKRKLQKAINDAFKNINLTVLIDDVKVKERKKG